VNIKKELIKNVKIRAVCAPEIGKKTLSKEFEATPYRNRDTQNRIDSDTRRAAFLEEKFREYGMVEIHVGGCCYQIINTQEALERFRLNLQKLPSEYFEMDF
jgi:hypothetical protein